MTAVYNLFLKLFLALIFFALGLLSAFMGWVLLHAPDVHSLNTCIVSSMNQVELCDKNDNYVHLPMVPQHLIDALVVNEDSTFFQHSGFDFYEIRQSIKQNIKRMEYYRGASTLSQQLVKNVFLHQEKDLARKIKEVYLTYSLEKHFNKKQILEKYLNVVEFGPDIYGLKAAANYYFDKAPIDLNVLESAYLVYLLPNPKGHSQSFHKKQLSKHAKKRIQLTLRRLLKYRKITEAKYMVASSHINEFPWRGVSLNIIHQIQDIYSEDEESL